MPASRITSAGLVAETGLNNAGKTATWMAPRHHGQEVGSRVLQGTAGRARRHAGQGTDPEFIAHATSAAPGRGKASSTPRAGPPTSKLTGGGPLPPGAAATLDPQPSPSPTASSSQPRPGTRGRTTD